jgi:hypothetical protein
MADWLEIVNAKIRCLSSILRSSVAGNALWQTPEIAVPVERPRKDSEAQPVARLQGRKMAAKLCWAAVYAQRLTARNDCPHSMI